MGFWGTGTFENDTALDFLGNELSRLILFVSSDIERANTDGLLERPTLAAVACLHAILDFGATPGALTSQQVVAWRNAYVEWLESSTEAMGTDTSTFKSLVDNAIREFNLLADAL